MSSSVHISIEVRENDKWNLIHTNTPIHLRHYEKEEDNAYFDKIKKWDIETPIISKKEVKGINACQITRQGDVRDYLKIYFKNNDFPTDMSEELKKKFAVLDKFKAQAIKEGEHTLFNEWGWGKSYCLLSELYDKAKENIGLSKERIETTKKDNENTKMMDELFRIEYLIINGSLPKEKKEDESKEADYYDAIAECEWEIESAETVCDFCNSIYGIVEFITGDEIDFDNIRLIFYFT